MDYFVDESDELRLKVEMIPDEYPKVRRCTIPIPATRKRESHKTTWERRAIDLGNAIAEYVLKLLLAKKSNNPERKTPVPEIHY